MLGSLILYLKGMRIMMFQLSGYYCKGMRMIFQLLASPVIVKLKERSLV